MYHTLLGGYHMCSVQCTMPSKYYKLSILMHNLVNFKASDMAHPILIPWSKGTPVAQMLNGTMGLYHPLDGDTNLRYKLLCFLTPNKKNSKRKAQAFNRDRCCHLALCLLVDSLPLSGCAFITAPKWQTL